MSFYKEVPGRQTTLESTLKFDTTPTEGSTNSVTSEGVKNAIDGAVGDAAENSLDDHDPDELIVFDGSKDFYDDHELGYYYAIGNKVWLCTEHTRSGEPGSYTYSTKLTKQNGIVPVLNQLVERITALKESVDKLSLGVNVSYEEDLKKYAPITPKKACIMFEMDCNANGVNSHLDEYADTLEQYGIKRSTFFPHSDLMDGSNPLYVSIMQRMQARGNEVSIHSVASDGIGQTDTSPTPTLSQFETIMQGYVSSFEGVGLSPIGWVTSRGTIHAEFREPLRKWVAYGHTLANKTAYPNFNVSTYVNDTDTDRLNILRIGLEYSAGEGETQADVDAEMLQCAKDAVDYAVANGGLVCFYAHSYKTTTIPYTMRAEVLEPLLAYIKTNYIDKHLIVSGTGAEVCKYYFG